VFHRSDYRAGARVVQLFEQTIFRATAAVPFEFAAGDLPRDTVELFDRRQRTLDGRGPRFCEQQPRLALVELQHITHSTGGHVHSIEAVGELPNEPYAHVTDPPFSSNSGTKRSRRDAVRP
jgi:hypothetical protein